MRNRDERPDDASGYPDDRSFEPGTRTVTVPRDADDGSVHDYDDYEDRSDLTPAERDREFYEDLGKRRTFAWNAGTDIGLLILRLGLGGVFAAHGARKLFAVLGGPGPQGFAEALRGMGYEQSSVLALVTGATELGGGALLVLGLFSPLAAAGLLGVMANVIALKHGEGFFLSGGSGIEFPLVLGVLAAGLLFTGPGRVSLDNGRPWFRHPIASGITGLIIAAAASAGILVFLHH